MKCPGCNNELHPHELAQPITVLGLRIRPRSFCDTCCRRHPWRAGSAASLERLITGQRDPIAQAQVDALTADWGLPFTAILTQAAHEHEDPPELWAARLADEPDHEEL
jgi:hypothetical protein